MTCADSRLHAARLFDLSGKRAVITGAASGIGFEIAAILSANGAHVTLLDVDGVKLKRATAEISSRGAACEALVVDVANGAELIEAIDQAQRQMGGLDIAVANAGMSAGPGFGVETAKTTGSILYVDDANWARVIDVNLTSVMRTIGESAKRMDQRCGRIIVTASIAGLRALPFVNYAYAATKAAVVNMVRQAAVELALQGITVNAIAPGFIATNIGGGRLLDPAIGGKVAETVPMRRLGDASEVAGLALYLASDASSYTTGTVIPVDGGVTAF